MTQPKDFLAILYANICDSTRLSERFGTNEALRLAERSMQTMTDITLRFGGTLIRTQGNGVMTTLPNADAACDAAQEMQRRHENGPLSIKVGFNYGAVISSGGDVYGDAVNLAARVSALARSGEILTTEETVGHLEAARRAGARMLDQTTVKGKSEPVRIYSLVNEKDRHATVLVSGDVQKLTLPQRATLTLEHAGQRIDLQSPSLPLVMGRAPDCQLVVNNDLVSRRHALIEPKRDHFVITDLSTNGTFIVTGDGEQVFLKRESARLVGYGHIWLGSNPGAGDADRISFALHGKAAETA